MFTTNSWPLSHAWLHCNLFITLQFCFTFIPHCLPSSHPSHLVYVISPLTFSLRLTFSALSSSWLSVHQWLYHYSICCGICVSMTLPHLQNCWVIKLCTFLFFVRLLLFMSCSLSSTFRSLLTPGNTFKSCCLLFACSLSVSIFCSNLKKVLHVSFIKTGIIKKLCTRAS